MRVFFAYSPGVLVERSFTKNSRNLKPGARLFGASWWKVVKALWLHEISQVSLFLLTGGAEVVNAEKQKFTKEYKNSSKKE